MCTTSKTMPMKLKKVASKLRIGGDKACCQVIMWSRKPFEAKDWRHVGTWARESAGHVDTWVHKPARHVEICAREHAKQVCKWVCKHARHFGTRARKHARQVGTWHESAQSTLVHEDVSMQDKLACKHVNMQDTLARDHVFSMRGTLFNRFFLNLNQENRFCILTTLLYSFVSMLLSKRVVKSLVWIIQ